MDASALCTALDDPHQLSRFLANEQAASNAVRQSLGRMSPPLGEDEAKRLLASLGVVARAYEARTLPPANVRATRSADGASVSLIASANGPFTEAAAAGGGISTAAGEAERRTPGGVLGSILGGSPNAPPPPPPPPNAPIKLGDDVPQPTKVKHVPAVYPPIAQSARVSGLVMIEATMGADGKVKGAKVTKSIPLLDQAAIDAVKRWEFTPTLLNGVPVPVIMTVTVHLTLK